VSRPRRARAGKGRDIERAKGYNGIQRAKGGVSGLAFEQQETECGIRNIGLLSRSMFF
jgi:hypothetical protein